ncbi:MAG: hypothetical protein N2689_08190, partial [Verrucomicrobiae bacterium]|nr:hypothetical protein [Verrucomicrobiae bacterium]
GMRPHAGAADANGVIRHWRLPPVAGARMHMNAFVVCNELSPDRTRDCFDQLVASPGVSGLYALLLYRSQDASLKRLAHDQAFWKGLRTLTSDRFVGLGIEEAGTSEALAHSSSLLNLFGWKIKDLPCLIICQPVQLLSSMRYLVVPLQRNGGGEPGRSDAATLLERLAKDIQIILASNYVDGFCLFTAAEYSVGYQAAKRGLTMTSAVWAALEDTAGTIPLPDAPANGQPDPNNA